MQLDRHRRYVPRMWTAVEDRMAVPICFIQTITRLRVFHAKMICMKCSGRDKESRRWDYPVVIPAAVL